ncbi:MAG TPA: EAL domain-containing protein [Acidimicrobiales bacterium]|nr:EAL domain-containing protein [Acidimicrobiales bacterium]
MSRAQAQESVDLPPACYVALVEHSPDLIFVVGDDGYILLASDTATELLGRPAKRLAGQPFFGLVHPDDRYELTRLIDETAAGSSNASGNRGVEMRLSYLYGTWIDTEVTATDLRDNPDVGGVMLTVRDARGRKRREDELQRFARYDELTGLANRTSFHDNVEQALAHLCRTPVLHAVLFIDLDGFKTINDSLGHFAGDEVLTTVAERLKSRLRPSDLGARLGGDEFAVLLENTSEADAVAVAERLLEALRLPMLVQGKSLVLTGSAGIAFSDLATSAETFLRDADVALYQAKRKGKARHEVFRPQMHESAVTRLQLETDLRRAVKECSLLLHYQPIVDLGTGRLLGLEALVRWPHAELGMRMPSEFIPLAEESELILPIGRAVLEQACHQAHRWAEQFPGQAGLSIAVNVSVRQLEDDHFVDEVVTTLRRSGLAPTSLVLEITESVFVVDVEASIEKISALKQLGVSVAIDDFGTGYSSLGILPRIPVDILKIDRSFVEGICRSPEESAVGRAVIDLARTFGLRIVAEGIERQDQLDELIRLGADMGQGYYLGRPLDVEATEALLESRSWYPWRHGVRAGSGESA